MNGKILQVLGPVVDVEFLAEGGSASGGEQTNDTPKRTDN